MALPRFREMLEHGLVPSAHQDDGKCPICHDNHQTIDLVTMSCSHSFCRTCISIWLQDNPNCPMCRAQLRRFTYQEACDAYAHQTPDGGWAVTREFGDWVEEARNLRPDNPPLVEDWLAGNVDAAVDNARRNLLSPPFAGSMFGLVLPPLVLPDVRELTMFLNSVQSWLDRGHPRGHGPCLLPASHTIRAALVVMGNVMSFKYTSRHLGPFQTMLNTLADVLDICGGRQFDVAEDIPAAIWNVIEQRLSLWEYTPGEATYFLDGDVVRIPSLVHGLEPLIRGGPLSQMRRNFDIIIDFVVRFTSVLSNFEDALTEDEQSEEEQPEGDHSGAEESEDEKTDDEQSEGE